MVAVFELYQEREEGERDRESERKRRIKRKRCKDTRVMNIHEFLS